MNIIIPLGGKGDRFKKANYDLPKPIIKIFEKEMILYVLDNLKLNKDDKIFMIYHNNLEEYNFENIILNKYPKISLIKLNKQTLGAAETLLYGINNIKNISPYKKCFILDCDTFYTEDILNMYRNINNNAIFYTDNYEPQPLYSYIKIENNYVVEIKEKIKISDNANTGIYCFNDILQLEHYCKYIIDNNITFKNEYYTSCVINEMLKNNLIFEPIKLNNNCVFNIGTPEQLNNYIKNTYLFLFDLDGTLVLTDDIYFDVWFEILQKFNIILTKDIFKNYIQGNSDNTVLRSLLQNNYKTLLENISRIKDELFLKNINKIKIIDGIDDFIKTIKLNGHKIAIVTNCNRNVAENILKYTNLFNYIDIIIIGNECNKSKPYPDPYLKALKYFNSLNDKAIIFEDSKTGIQSGKNTFPKCLIGIETLYSCDEIINIGVDFSIKNYINLDLLKILTYNNMNSEKIKRYIINSLPHLNIKNIEFMDHKLKGGFISDVIALKIYTDNNILDCVIKLENKNETFLSKMANELGLYEREYYFYESLSKYVSIKKPEFLGLIKDDNFNNIGILMNNLNNLGFSLNLNLNNEKIDVSLKIIERLAQLHSKFWNKDLQKNFKELKKHNDNMFNPKWNNFIREKWPYFKNKWQSILTENNIQKAQYIVNNFQNIQNNLSDNNLTLCHGDVKSPNIFYEKLENNYEPYFIDWQYICIGKGVQDLVFFMIESFEISVINKYKIIFKDYYYIKLLENGITNYSYEDYNIDFNNSICYFPFFVAIWFGTVNDDELIDKNFPFFFIQKLFNFIN
jgi:beta-phosphoglucomutase-like phosphatase (HAD superfamily)/choline kinase